MLLWAYDFMRSFAGNRLCWIAGRFGSGKTLLSLFMAQWLVDNQYAVAVASNIPIVGAIQPYDIPVPFRNCAVIVDEASLYLDHWTRAKKYLAFVRKFNHYVIMPSVWPPSPRLRDFTVRRFADLSTVGFPLWIYRWRIMIPGEKTEGGYFGLYHPEKAFGIYSTTYIPSDDGGISRAIEKTMLLTGFKGSEDEQSGTFSGFEDAGEAIERASYRIASSSRRR